MSAGSTRRQKASEQTYDAVRLVRLVRVRREARLAWVLALIGFPVWFVAVVGGQAVIPQSSPVWDWLGNSAGLGFAVLAIALVAGLAVQFAVRTSGPTGRLAARMVPVFGSRPEPVETGAPGAAVRAARTARQPAPGTVSLVKTVQDRPREPGVLRGLIPVLRRREYVAASALLVAMVLLVLTVFVGSKVVPVYRANHGHGGPRFTIGAEYNITRTETHYGRHGTTTDYYIDTPVGEALAEDRKPHDGQQWVVLDNSTGEPDAYLVGGHDYLLVGGISFAAALGFVFLCWLMWRQARTERSRRTKAGHVPLSVTLARLGLGEVGAFELRSSGGGRLRPSVADTRKDPGHQPAWGPYAVVLLPHRRETEARVRGHRRLAVVAGVVAVLVLAGGGYLLFRPGGSDAPTHRDVAAPYLGPVGWDPSLFVTYDDEQSARDLLVDAIGEVSKGKPAVGPSWGVIISCARDDVCGEGTTANLDVHRVSGPGTADAGPGVVKLEQSLGDYDRTTTTVLTGLPDGWCGISTDGAGTRTARVDLATSVDGYVVWLTYYGDVTDAGKVVPGPPDASVVRAVVSLAAVIAEHGVARFAQETAP